MNIYQTLMIIGLALVVFYLNQITAKLEGIRNELKQKA